MVGAKFIYWTDDPQKALNAIRKQHEDVFRNHTSFYMHYPILQRWKLKTKEQHFQAARVAKGKKFVCNWCVKKSCTVKMNTEQEFFDHITNICLAQGNFAFQTENEYRQRRGWPAADAESNKSSTKSSTGKSSTGKSSTDQPSADKSPDGKQAKPVSDKKAKKAKQTVESTAESTTKSTVETTTKPIAKLTASSGKTSDKPQVKRKSTDSGGVAPKRVKKAAGEKGKKMTGEDGKKANDEKSSKAKKVTGEESEPAENVSDQTPRSMSLQTKVTGNRADIKKKLGNFVSSLPTNFKPSILTVSLSLD